MKGKERGRRRGEEEALKITGGKDERQESENRRKKERTPHTHTHTHIYIYIHTHFISFSSLLPFVVRDSMYCHN